MGESDVREVQKLYTGSERQKAGSKWVEIVNECPLRSRGTGLSTGHFGGSLPAFF